MRYVMGIRVNSDQGTLTTTLTRNQIINTAADIISIMYLVLLLSKIFMPYGVRLQYQYSTQITTFTL